MPRVNQSIPCPHCGGKSAVLDTRLNGNDVRRRRRCKDCEKNFSTIELDFDEFTKIRRAASPKVGEIKTAMLHLEKALK